MFITVSIKINDNMNLFLGGGGGGPSLVYTWKFIDVYLHSLVMTHRGMYLYSTHWALV